MALTAFSGPVISFGLTQTSTGIVQEYNEERGPSLFDLGFAIEDPRFQFSYQPGSPVGTKIYGFLQGRALVDYVPITISTNAIAAAQTPAASAALTLTAGSSASGTYATTIIAPETGAVTGTLIAIDSTAAVLAYGQAGTVAIWNPAAGTGRCVSITTSSSGDGGSWSIAGRDMYGFKMTENLSVTGSSNTVTSRKAFKYISSIKASTTVTSTGIIVGFSDTYGLPLLGSNTGIDLSIRVIATSSLAGQNSSGPITIGSTATQTATSSDPRGTYASTTASNGTVRLQIAQNITPNMLSAVTATDTSLMFGASQFSSV